jgi:hypothetical protein
MVLASGIADTLRALPEAARRTVTFDGGSEFAGYAGLGREFAVASYLCDPHSARQKGAIENATGRVRGFLPRERARRTLPDPPPAAAERFRCVGWLRASVDPLSFAQATRPKIWCAKGRRAGMPSPDAADTRPLLGSVRTRATFGL